MQLTLLYPGSRRIDAVVLAADYGRMRIVIPNRRDTVELRLTGRQWTSEEGESVEIEAILACAWTGESFRQPRYLAASAA
ncbi:MAG: hypothetical protein ABSB88_09475 [Bryobacteraceae bacterium]|jgi:hypothetical protein